MLSEHGENLCWFCGLDKEVVKSGLQAFLSNLGDIASGKKQVA